MPPPIERITETFVRETINPGGVIQTGGGTPFQSTARKQSEGLIVRFQPIKGTTPKAVLDHRIWLPAVLNTVTLTEAALHNEYDTLSAGQFSQGAMGPPGAVSQLRDLPIDTLTVAYDAPWFAVVRQNPLRIRDTLTRIMRSRKPVHLLGYLHPSRGEQVLNVIHPVSTPEFDFNVTLRQGTRELRDGENETRYLTFQLKEWRDPSVDVRTSSRPKGGNSGRKVHLPTTTKLKATDTLNSLAMEFYGTYKDWRLIATANGVPKRFGASTALVTLKGRFKVGAKIKIPALPKHTPPSGGAGLS